MNQDQVLSIVRSVLSILGTVLVTRGLVGDTDWTTISGAVLMLTPVIWSMFVHSQQGKLAAAAKLPEVQKIVVDPATATATPSAKVVAP